MIKCAAPVEYEFKQPAVNLDLTFQAECLPCVLYTITCFNTKGLCTSHTQGIYVFRVIYIIKRDYVSARPTYVKTAKLSF